MLSTDRKRRGPKQIGKRGRGALARFRGCRPRKLGGRCPHPRVTAVAKKAQPPRRWPSPWTGAVDFLDLAARASKKVGVGVDGFAENRENRQPLSRERDPNRRIEKRDAGSEWLQKDQKQNRQQKRADHAVNDAELAARRGSRFILERDNPPVKPEMKAQ